MLQIVMNCSVRGLCVCTHPDIHNALLCNRVVGEWHWQGERAHVVWPGRRDVYRPAPAAFTAVSPLLGHLVQVLHAHLSRPWLDEALQVRVDAVCNDSSMFTQLSAVCGHFDK